MRQTSSNAARLLLPAALVLVTSSCGLIEDEDALDITYPAEIPIEFAIDGSVLCPADPNIDCDGDTVPSDRDIALRPLTFDDDVDIVEATGNTEFQEIADRIKAVNVKSISYAASDNDLNFDLPPIAFHVGPKEAEAHGGSGVVELATIPSIPAGEDTEGVAVVDETSVPALSEIFKTLKLSAIPYATPEVKKGDPMPPRGSATLKLVLRVDLVANPTDQF